MARSPELLHPRQLSAVSTRAPRIRTTVGWLSTSFGLRAIESSCATLYARQPLWGLPRLNSARACRAWASASFVRSAIGGQVCCTTFSAPHGWMRRIRPSGGVRRALGEHPVDPVLARPKAASAPASVGPAFHLEYKQDLRTGHRTLGRHGGQRAFWGSLAACGLRRRRLSVPRRNQLAARTSQLRRAERPIVRGVAPMVARI